jgi:hypothetical protein
VANELTYASGQSSISKAAKAPYIFSLEASNATVAPDGTSGKEWPISAVGKQWKIKEILWSRVNDTASGLTHLTVYLVDSAGKKFVLGTATPGAATDLQLRYAPTLTSGENFIPADAEVQVEFGTISDADDWSLRVVGALVR